MRSFTDWKRNWERGRLWFEGKIIDQQVLSIRIRDDGVGIEGDVLERITARLKEGHETNKFDGSNENIGIKNVGNRIKLTYGDEYGIQIGSVSGQGTEVTIRLPARRN